MNAPANLPPVTICPPHKRAYRRPPPSGERVPADPIVQQRVNALTEARERDRIMSVVRNQPHRRGLDNVDDKRAGDPLAAFCEQRRLKPGLYAAGVEYGAIVRQHRAAIDAPAAGLVRGPSDEAMSDEQRAAAIALVKQRRREADEVLTGIIGRAPSVMADLCCEMRPWRPYDEDLILNCLYRLAVHLKTIDFGINSEKVY